MAGTQNSLLERISLDYPLLSPEIDASKDLPAARKAIRKTNGRHWKKVLDGTPFRT
jgi:hypothetical protein